MLKDTVNSLEAGAEPVFGAVDQITICVIHCDKWAYSADEIKIEKLI